MSAVSLTLSNNVQYSFEFYGTTLNQRAIPEVVCRISWVENKLQELWTTSFNENNLQVQAAFTAEYLVTNKTDLDIQVIVALYQKVVDGINKSKGTT